MKKIIFLLLAVLIYSGCYEQTITIGSDRLNGKISYKVEYSRVFEDFLSNTSNKKDIDLNTSVLFDKTRLRQVTDRSDGLNLIYYNLTASDDSRTAEAEINFDKAENLSNGLPAAYFPTTIYENNMVVYCQTIIALKKIINYNILSLTPEEETLLNDYISLIKFSFIYKTPKNIIKANRGRLLQDRKTLVYETSLSELLKSKEDIDITLSYRK